MGAATDRRDFAADLLQMQQRVIIHANSGCSRRPQIHHTARPSAHDATPGIVLIEIDFPAGASASNDGTSAKVRLLTLSMKTRLANCYGAHFDVANSEVVVRLADCFEAKSLVCGDQMCLRAEHDAMCWMMLMTEP
jgi:hypothetical protein